MNAAAFLAFLRTRPDYRQQIIHVQKLPPRLAQYGQLERPLPSLLEARLKELAWLPLYSHQAQAVNAADLHRNVMVSTPSASGKTLCYNLPVIRAVIEEKGSRALYLFPTKALAQDQMRSFRDLACPQIMSAMDIATFDGDTPQEIRSEIKNGPGWYSLTLICSI